MALAVKSTMNNDHLKTLDAILKEPLSDVRMKLHQHMQGFTPAYKEMVKQKDPAKAQAISDQIQQAADQHFNEGHFNAYMDGLRKFAQDDLGGQNLAAFDREVAKAREAIETGDTTFDPNPSVRVNQLVWAVTLSYLTVNPKAQEKWADKNKALDVTDTKVWNKVLESDTLEDELLDHAFHLSEEITNKDTKLRWGAPGSWFYNNREEPAINLDLIESLTLGLEHTRAAAYHEMGHNKLTVKLPQSMLDILGKLEAQDEKVEKGHKLTEDEYVERQKLAAEMQARHKIFNVCEDNTVNQYAVRQSVSLDYSVSINYTNVL
ncbi:MAG: hypothetical protein FJX23_09930, partial [Alphaproteobacteria bacterium]|nr:hypothetical protein [Alphaproteobacteria bacterium]